MAVELSDIIELAKRENGKMVYRTPSLQSTSAAIQNAALLANHFNETINIIHHGGIKFEIQPKLSDEEVLHRIGSVEKQVKQAKQEAISRYVRSSGTQTGFRTVN